VKINRSNNKDSDQEISSGNWQGPYALRKGVLYSTVQVGDLSNPVEISSPAHAYNLLRPWTAHFTRSVGLRLTPCLPPLLKKKLNLQSGLELVFHVRRVVVVVSSASRGFLWVLQKRWLAVNALPPTIIEKKVKPIVCILTCELSCRSCLRRLAYRCMWGCLMSVMDHAPLTRTFELGKFISTAGKSLINWAKLWSLTTNYHKHFKI
jgi:hypothetical protein